MSATKADKFSQLNLSKPLIESIREIGYEDPSPIQAETIPLLLEGKDVLGQAQTGTGKTAAFALPILSNLDFSQRNPQALVLTPTRELAIQVAEAFQKYASRIQSFHVLPIYGGQDYGGQIRALKRGVHVVVGTPGRVMDHMRKKTLKLGELKTLVLDEADEMLRMGFIDDVEWVLEQIPKPRQIALFSATMPNQIRRIATNHLSDPAQVTIKVKTATANLIRQRFWPVSGLHKLDALTRILEAETFDGMIIFVRTRIVTVELAQKLTARGFAATALNGDIAQNQRERTIEQLKKGQLDIIVATDVAARGLDVDRISHVINYDIPHDTEAYIHRIGRTGRAGRHGDAILFVAPRERRMLAAIERATQKKIDIMELPSTKIINTKRIETFKENISRTLTEDDLSLFLTLIEQYQKENDTPPLKIAAALAKLLQGDTPLLLEHKPIKKGWPSAGKEKTNRFSERGETSGRQRKEQKPMKGMQRYRIAVGHIHQVMPGNIVGAIANETGIDAKDIGRINIFDDYSTVDLPEKMPDEIFSDLQKTWVAGQTLKITRLKETEEQARESKHGEKPQRKRTSPKGGNKKPPTKKKPNKKAKLRAAQKQASEAKDKATKRKKPKSKSNAKSSL
jgi:ATP-dependent RNA helicase DeaD